MLFLTENAKQFADLIENHFPEPRIFASFGTHPVCNSGVQLEKFYIMNMLVLY